jgi:hypothetical protein
MCFKIKEDNKKTEKSTCAQQWYEEVEERKCQSGRGDSFAPNTIDIGMICFF